MIRYLVTAFALALISIPEVLAESAALQVEMPLPPSISVTGLGQVSARPDMAEINVGVATQATTASAALTANNTAMTTLMATLKSGGVEEKDILTSNFSVNPEYRQDNAEAASGRPPRISGYRVDNSVQIKVRNLATLGTLLDAVVRSGANNINGVSFTIAKPEPLLDKARAIAVTDARRRADLYALAAGVKVGKVLYITESSAATPRPMPMARMESAYASASSVPIGTGEQQLEATIGVVYTIEP